MNLRKHLGTPDELATTLMCLGVVLSLTLDNLIWLAIGCFFAAYVFSDDYRAKAAKDQA